MTRLLASPASPVAKTEFHQLIRRITAHLIEQSRSPCLD
jgi:hypothetical protein